MYLKILNDINDELYEKFIEYAFSKCDAVMFVSNKIGFSNEEIDILEKTIGNLKQNYTDSFLKSRNGSIWVSRNIGSKNQKKDPKFENLFEILFYSTSKEIQEYLLSNKDVYAWCNPQYPEDISFFKNGYCWFHVITHESNCFLFCENKEEFNYLKSIGFKFDDEYCFSSMNKPYFEEYLNN